MRPGYVAQFNALRGIVSGGLGGEEGPPGAIAMLPPFAQDDGLRPAPRVRVFSKTTPCKVDSVLAGGDCVVGFFIIQFGPLRADASS